MEEAEEVKKEVEVEEAEVGEVQENRCRQHRPPEKSKELRKM